MKKLLPLLLFVLIFALQTFAKNKYVSHARSGGAVITSGVSSTTKALRVFGGATVSVFAYGTVTPVSLWSDDGVTSKSNPFTASTDGSFVFWADAAYVDVQISGSGITTYTFTLATATVSNPGAATTSALGLVKISKAAADPASPVAVEKTDAATNVNLGLVTTSTSGSVAVSTTDSRVNESVNVKHHGAIGDGVTDDTAAFAAAIAVVNSARRPLYIPAGKYLMSSLASAMVITKGVEVFGDGMGASLIVIPSTYSTSQDVFRISPPATGVGGLHGPAYGQEAGRDNRGYHWHDFAIMAASGTPGRDAIRIDVSTANQFIHDSSFKRLSLNLNHTSGGYSIRMLNNAGGGQVNADSISHVTVAECWLNDGILADYAADSITIQNNIFRGTNRSEFTFTAGAANFRFTENVLVSKNGMTVHNGPAGLYLNNYIEMWQSGSIGSGSAGIFLQGDVSPITGAVVSGNVFGSVGGILLDGIRLGAASQTVITKNSFYTPPGRTLIVFDSPTTSAETILYPDNHNYSGGIYYTVTAAPPSFVPYTTSSKLANNPGFMGVDNFNTRVLQVTGQAVPDYPASLAGGELVYDTNGRITSVGVLDVTGGSGLTILQSADRTGAPAGRDMFISGSRALFDFGSNGIHFGSGSAALKYILSAAPSLDYAQALAGACETLTASVPGVEDDGNWAVTATPAHALANHNTTSVMTVWVSAIHVVSVRRCVTTADGSDPAAAAVRIMATKF